MSGVSESVGLWSCYYLPCSKRLAYAWAEFKTHQQSVFRIRKCYLHWYTNISLNDLFCSYFRQVYHECKFPYVRADGLHKFIILSTVLLTFAVIRAKSIALCTVNGHLHLLCYSRVVCPVNYNLQVPHLNTHCVI